MLPTAFILSTIFFCVQVNGEWNSYKLTQSFASEWMNKTLMAADLLAEFDNDFFTGHLSNIHKDERQISDFGFRFRRPYTGEFEVSVNATADQLTIARNVIAQLTRVGSDPELNPMNETFNITECATWEGYSLEQARNIYNREVTTEESKDGGILNRKLTTEAFLSSQLGGIILDSSIEKVSSDSVHAPGPILFDSTVHHVENDDWARELVNENFCEGLKRQALEIGQDFVIDLSRFPKNNNVDKFALMKKNVRHAPTTNDTLKQCYLALKETPASYFIVTKKASLTYAISAMVQAGTLESLRFLSYLIENEPRMILGVDVSSIADDVPKALLGPAYLRQFYQLVIKAMDSGDVTESVKTAFVISFSSVLRRTMTDSIPIEARPNEEEIGQYLTFFNVTHPDYQNWREGREHVFIRALANIPTEQSVETLHQLYNRSDSLEMKLFIVNSMDKLAKDLPEPTAEALFVIQNANSENVIEAATFVQVMKTGLLDVEDIQTFSENSINAWEETFKQVMAVCLNKQYGEEMATICKNASGDTFTAYRPPNIYATLNQVGVIIETSFDINNFVGYLTLRTEQYTLSITKLKNECLIIAESGYSQLMMDCSAVSPEDLNSLLLFSSSSQSVNYPTTLPGFKYFRSTVTPFLLGVKLLGDPTILELSAILSFYNETQHGVIDMINGKEYVIGVDRKVELNLPKLQLQAKIGTLLQSILNPNRVSLRLDIVDENFVLDRDFKLVHISQKPYTVARDYFHNTPTGQDVNTIQILRHPVEEISLPNIIAKIFGDEFSMPTGIATSADLKVGEDEDSDYPLIIGYNMWLNASRTTTRSMELNVDLTQECTNKFLMKTTKGYAFRNAGVYSTSYRTWKECMSPEASLVFHGPPTIGYKVKAIYGETQSENFFSSIIAKIEIDGVQNYQVCGDLGVKAVGEVEDPDFELYGDLEYGEQCRETNRAVTVTIKDNGRRFLDSDRSQKFSKAVINHKNTTPVMMSLMLCHLKRTNATFVPPLQC